MIGEKNELHGGDELVSGITQIEAHHWLAYLKIKWERVLVDRMSAPFRNPYYGNYDRIPVDGVHHYFMVGDTDVAYFTPLMQTLHIHKHPRRWAPEALMKTRELYRFGDHVP